MPRGVKLVYTDDDLRKVVADARSWHDVLRVLGYHTANGALVKAVRHRADALDLDYSHFVRSGRASWTDRDLSQAVQSAVSWEDAVCRLGITPDVSAIA